MIKFTIVTGSLKITNTISESTLVLAAKKDISSITNSLYQEIPKIQLYNINIGSNAVIINEPLENCVDENDIPFTVETFITFAANNFGFNGEINPRSIVVVDNFAALPNASTVPDKFYWASNATGNYLTGLYYSNGMAWEFSEAIGIIAVTNYTALPNPTTVSGLYYWVSNTQGTSWLPGSLGGTFYNKGMYYSNGTTWEYIDIPYQATQAEVNVGTNNDKFVTPFTFTNSNKWGTKENTITQGTTAQYYRGDKTFQTLNRASVGLNDVDNTSDADKPVSTAQASAIGLKESSANKEASGGFVGLTLFKINFKNTLNTFTSFFTNSNTAERTYTFKDADGTMAFTSDINATAIAEINHAAAEKTTLVDADEITGQNSATSFSLIRVTCLNVYNYLKLKFDIIYAKIMGNLVVVNNWTTDLPAIVSGNITLADNKTYLTRGLQIMGTVTITQGVSNAILGLDKSSDGYVYSGSSAFLINSNKDCTISNITLAATAVGGSIFNFTGSTNKLEIKENIFANSKTIGTINGGDVLVMSKNFITGCSEGLSILGTYNFADIADTLSENNLSTITCLSIPSGTFGQIKISRNVFSMASGQTAINIGTPTVVNGVIELCDFLGVGTYLTGINELTPNWQLRANRGTNFKNTILYQPRALDRSWFSVRASNATRASNGIVTTGFGTATNNTDSITGLTKYTTSSVLGSFAGIESTAFTELPVNASPIFTSVIKTDSAITNQRLWAGLFSATLSDSDDQSGSYIAFRHSTVAGDTGWRAIVDNGTTQTVSSNIGTISTSTYYYLEIRADYQNSKCYFQVNNGGWTTVSSMPSSGTKMGFCVELTNPDIGASSFNFSRLDCNHL